MKLIFNASHVKIEQYDFFVNMNDSWIDNISIIRSFVKSNLMIIVYN